MFIMKEIRLDQEHFQMFIKVIIQFLTKMSQ